MNKCMNLNSISMVIYVAKKILSRIIKIAKSIYKSKLLKNDRILENYYLFILESIHYWKENFFKIDYKFLKEYNKIKFLYLGKNKFNFQIKSQTQNNLENISDENKKMIKKYSMNNNSKKKYHKQDYCKKIIFYQEFKIKCMRNY